VLSADSKVDICLPGYVGLYVFNESDSTYPKGVWRSLTAINGSSLSAESVEADLRIPAFYAVIATQQCNDVNGIGRAGGDKVCLSSTDSRGAAVAYLGGLTTSRMPTLSLSTRPAIRSAADMTRYLNATADPIRASLAYHTRASWRQLCPGGAVISANSCPENAAAQLAWFSARFGHSAALVSTGRLIIFGGLGCGAFGASGHCTAVQVLSDLWEIDVRAALAGGTGPSALRLDPTLPGLIGHVSIALSGESQRIIIVGGASESFQKVVVSTLERKPPAPVLDGEVFEMRELMFRTGTAKSSKVGIPLKFLRLKIRFSSFLDTSR
jgi:hypothetical protein